MNYSTIYHFVNCDRDRDRDRDRDHDRDRDRDHGAYICARLTIR